MTVNTTWQVRLGKESGDKLGLVLDKDASTPRVGKITQGGACEAAVTAGARLSAGCEIVAVGSQSIDGMCHADAVKAIKAHEGRPLLLTLREPAALLRRPKLLTAEQVAARSEKATAEGLRNIVAATKSSPGRRLSDSDGETSDDSSGSDLDSDLDSHRRRKARQTGCKSKRSARHQQQAPDAATHRLEKKVHFLQLQLLNMQVDAEDKAAELTNELEPLQKVNELMVTLQDTKRQVPTANGDHNDLSASQMKKQLSQWRQDFTEQETCCKEAIDKVKLQEVKRCLMGALEEEAKSCEHLEQKGAQLIQRAHLREFAAMVSMWIVGVATMLLLGYMLMQHALVVD